MNLIIHFIIINFNLDFLKATIKFHKYLFDFTNLYFNLNDYLFFLPPISHFNISIIYSDHPLHIQLQHFTAE
jgi:hypothetical protein